MSNMSAPFGFGYGARYMMDQTMKFTGEGLPVFLRMQPVDESVNDVADIGFIVTVSGSLTGSAGYTDHQIIPQPIMEVGNSNRIGVEETQMQFGPTNFTISQTWVLQMMDQFGYIDPLQVFRDRRVIGLVVNNEIYSIENISDRHAGGQIVYWDLVTKKADLLPTG